MTNVDHLAPRDRRSHQHSLCLRLHIIDGENSALARTRPSSSQLFGMAAKADCICWRN
ncbi:hypothetical protein QWJ07_05895 [Frankia sp. RB7]|nr:hypothetical protein [Frankia sp. RB7]